jgi:hypothetical protein
VTPDEVVRVVDAIVRLGSVLWQWLTDEDHEKPVTASAVALATMLATDDGVRAELVHRCAANPALRQQLVDLCDAYEEDWPVFGRVRKEIDHAAR